jgi:hypothetical protein
MLGLGFVRHSGWMDDRARRLHLPRAACRFVAIQTRAVVGRNAQCFLVVRSSARCTNMTDAELSVDEYHWTGIGDHIVLQKSTISGTCEYDVPRSDQNARDSKVRSDRLTGSFEA